MTTPYTIDRKSGEDRDWFRAFLLYGMMYRPDEQYKRSVSALERVYQAAGMAAGKSRSNLKDAKRRNSWDQRLEFKDSHIEAATIYAKDFGFTEDGIVLVNCLMNQRDEVNNWYTPPEGGEGKRARVMDRFSKAAVEAEASAKTTEELAVSLKSILNMMIQQLQERVAKEELDLKSSDIQHISKLMSIWKQLQDDIHEQAAGAKQAGPSYALSKRVEKAIEDGGSVWEALEEDCEEMLVVIRAAKEHEKQAHRSAPGGVLDFPGLDSVDVGKSG